MNNAVQTGEIQKVVENGKMLEIASAQLREAETTIAHMDTALGGSLETATCENAIKNLALAGGHAPGLGAGGAYVPSPPSQVLTPFPCPGHAISPGPQTPRSSD